MRCDATHGPDWLGSASRSTPSSRLGWSAWNGRLPLAGMRWFGCWRALSASASRRRICWCKEALSRNLRDRRAVARYAGLTGSPDESGSKRREQGLSKAIRATAADTEDAVRDMEEDEAMTREAVDLLNSRRNDPYEAATAALREDTQQWWADTLARDPAELEEDEEPATADAEGLRRFLEGEVLAWFEARKKELANRPLIREQAFGESLDPDKLERLGRYEVHLDRKLERTLAMLLRLKDLRQGAIAG